MGAFTAQDAADRAAAQLGADLPRVQALHDGKNWKVRVGAFPMYADALIARDSLRARGFPDAFIVQTTDARQPDAEAVLPWARHVKTEHLAAIRLEAATSSSPASREALANAYRTLKRDGKAAAAPLFANLAQAADVSAGEAALRLAYIQYANGDSTGALEQFSSVGSGRVPVSPQVQAEALTRCAAICHARKDLLGALQSLREQVLLCEAHGIACDSSRVQIAGLYLELAMNGKGSLAEAESCIKDLSSARKFASGDEATLRLMLAESAAMRNDYSNAKDHAAAVLNLVPADSPLALHASYVLAVCHYSKGDYAAASAVSAKALGSGAQPMPKTRLLEHLTRLHEGATGKTGLRQANSSVEGGQP